MSSMSISGSQSFSGLNAVSGLRPPPSPREASGHSSIDAVTDVLGMSAEEITSALQEGKSLDDLAESQGVSHEDLIAALKAGMPDDLAQSADAYEIAEKIASQSGLQGPQSVQGPGGMQRPGSPGGYGTASYNATTSGYGSAARVSGLDGSAFGVLGSSLTTTQQQTLDTLSNLLGSDSESLIDSLRNGTSLAELVAGMGLGSNALAGVIQDGLLVDTKY